MGNNHRLFKDVNDKEIKSFFTDIERGKSNINFPFVIKGKNKYSIVVSVVSIILLTILCLFVGVIMSDSGQDILLTPLIIPALASLVILRRVQVSLSLKKLAPNLDFNPFEGDALVLENMVVKSISPSVLFLGKSSIVNFNDLYCINILDVKYPSSNEAYSVIYEYVFKNYTNDVVQWTNVNSSYSSIVQLFSALSLSNIPIRFMYVWYVFMAIDNLMKVGEKVKFNLDTTISSICPGLDLDAVYKDRAKIRDIALSVYSSVKYFPSSADVGYAEIQMISNIGNRRSVHGFSGVIDDKNLTVITLDSPDYYDFKDGVSYAYIIPRDKISIKQGNVPSILVEGLPDYTIEVIPDLTLKTDMEKFVKILSL